MFEETIRGTATEVLAHYTNKPPKGEIVVIVDGKKQVSVIIDQFLNVTMSVRLQSRTM